MPGARLTKKAKKNSLSEGASSKIGESTCKQLCTNKIQGKVFVESGILAGSGRKTEKPGVRNEEAELFRNE